MRHLALCCTLVPLVLLAACLDEGRLADPADPLSTVGRLSVALEQSPGIGAGFVAHLRVFATGEEEATADVQRALEPRGTFAEVLFLEQGSYRVLLDILDAQGFPVWSGATDGANVYPGLLTSLQLALQPAGGVQVVARVASGGDTFEPVGPAASNNMTQTFQEPTKQSGYQITQVNGAIKYFLPSCVPDQGGAQRTYVAQSLTTFVSSVSPVPGLGSEHYVPGGTPPLYCGADSALAVAFAPAGGKLYSALVFSSNVLIYREDQEIAAVPLAPRGMASTGGQLVYDRVERCALLVDNQFNLFCLAVEHQQTAFAPAHPFFRIVHAFSPDGTIWSPLLDYGDAIPEGQSKPALQNVVATVDSSRTGYPSVGHISASLAVLLHGGIYHLWLVTQQTGAARWSSLLHAVSTDRRHWSALDEAIGQTQSKKLTASVGQTEVLQDTAFYRAPDGFHMLYRTKPLNVGKLRLAKSVE